MIICAMQPYLFPYLPYFQLARAAEAFWVLDDVQYIRRGWMHRNRVLLNGRVHPLTFPVAKGTRGDRIDEKRLAEGGDLALNKRLETLQHGYAKAPYKDEMLSLLQGLRGTHLFLEAALETLQRSFAAMGVTTPIHRAASLKLPETLRGQDRILALCQAVGATTYLNPIGGRALYDPAAFAARGLALRFLQGACPAYPQTGGQAFVPGLSILDVVAHVAPRDRAAMLGSYSLSE